MSLLIDLMNPCSIQIFVSLKKNELIPNFLNCSVKKKKSSHIKFALENQSLAVASLRLLLCVGCQQ